MQRHAQNVQNLIVCEGPNNGFRAFHKGIGLLPPPQDPAYVCFGTRTPEKHNRYNV